MTTKLKNHASHPGGFTLFELLISVAIVGVVAAALIPAISLTFERARCAICKSNLRQMMIAAHAYAAEHNGAFPPAYERNYDDQTTTTWEAFLWDYDGRSISANPIQQCPSFKGAAMWEGDHYTGYNYNSSYLGGVRYIFQNTVNSLSIPSAYTDDIQTPSACAVFGDGQYTSGANKFMRSPYPGPMDADAGTALAGTQGFRHLRNSTHVAFADGSVRALHTRYTKTAARGEPASKCGFLSEDNTLYDLN